MNVADRSLPPMVLEGDLVAQWKKWKQLFEIYLIASELDKKPEAQQCAVLLHFIGEKCVEIYNTFELKKDEEGKIGPLKQNFESYFAPKKNETYSRYKFFSRNIEANETIDQYVTELKCLAADCNFEKLKDSLIRDRIVLGINDNKTREKLLQAVDLTLEKALNICRSIEVTKQQCTEINSTKINKDEILAVNKFKKPNAERNLNHQFKHQHAKYRAPNNQQNQHTHKHTGNNYNNKSNNEFQCRFIQFCTRCGQSHNINKCPAYKIICSKCNKLNHFAKMCKSKVINEVTKANDIDYNPYDGDDENNQFIGTVKDETNNKEWLVDLEINKVIITFKIDTGAQANCISLKTFKKLNLDVKYLKGSKSKLLTYTGTQINVVGECHLRCIYKNNLYFINFQVIDSENVPSILGVETCDHLNLLKKLFTINSTNQTENEVHKKFKQLFKNNGNIKMKPYNISLHDNVQPVVHPPRKVPFALINELKKELAQLEREGIVAKVNEPTPWVNSLVVVRKNNGKLRICIDPKDLNNAIRREHFQLPTVEEMLCKLNGAQYFSLLDASQGFWQIKLTKASSKLCTFNTPFGRYCFLRLPFGISSAPEVFHRTMKTIIQGLKGVDVYIDDIIIWGSTKEEHNERLNETLERLKEYNVSLNKDKCKIQVQELNYLGHKISNKGVEPDEHKIKAIAEIRQPTNKKTLEKFLGLVNYLSIYIQNYSKLAAPLRELLKKDICWHWNETHENSFVKLKEAITHPPVLKYFDPSQDIVLSVDASQHGVGSVLLQNGKPVAYSSKALTESQRNWAQIEKELYAILCACERYYQYIYGRKVLIETDHKPLITIIKKPLVTCPKRLQRMLLRLQNYDFDLTYKPGKRLFIADTLSRISNYNEKTDNNFDKELEAHVCTLIRNLNISEPQLIKFQSLTEKDQQLTKLKEYIIHGWPENKNLITDNLNEFKTYKDELTIYNELIFKNNQIVVPREMRREMLNRLHTSHMGIDKCIERARNCIFWPNMTNDIKNVVKNCNACATYKNTLCKEPLMPHEFPKYPWQKIGIDIFQFDNKNYLLSIDYYSKFFEISVLENMLANTIIRNLKSIFSRQGIPEIVMSDNGPQFSAYEFKLFAKQWEFSHITSSPRYPKSNGLVERHIQTIKNILKKCKLNNSDMYLAMLELRNTPTKGNYSPSQLLNKRSLRSLVPVNIKTKINYEQYENTMMQNQYKGKTYHDLHTKSHNNYDANEQVRVQLGNKWIPGTIHSKCSRPRSYQITLNNGQKIERNRKFITLDRVKPPGMFTYNNNKEVEERRETDKINNEEKRDNEGENEISENKKPNEKMATRSGRISRPPCKYWLGERT